MSIGDFPKSLSQATLVGIMLAGRLGVIIIVIVIVMIIESVYIYIYIYMYMICYIYIYICILYIYVYIYIYICMYMPPKEPLISSSAPSDDARPAKRPDRICFI